MNEDIRLTQLAVTICRDPNWARKNNLTGLVRDALLYSGVPSADVLKIVNTIQRTHLSEGDAGRDSPSHPVGLFNLLNYLNARGLLPDFLTQMLTFYKPVGIQRKEFLDRLQPLGLDWDPTSNRIRPTATRPQEEHTIRTELDSLLMEVDGIFPKMLRGALEAYYSDNPDRYRHCITSCRELLRQVMDKLGEGKTRREKIQHIIGSSSTAEVVDAAASLVVSICDAQSAGTHASIGQSTALFVLVETEHVLYFLLKQKP